MKTKVLAIHASLLHEKGAILKLPLEANIKRENVKTFEELKEKWSKKDPENLWKFEDNMYLAEIEVEQPNSLMVCANFEIVCFKEKMYEGWGTFHSCWLAYEFGDTGLKAEVFTL